MAIGIIIGIIVIVVAAGLILTYTNAFDVIKPEVESSVGKAKDAISQVDGNDVVKKAEEVSDKIKEVSDKIKVSNPQDSEK